LTNVKKKTLQLAVNGLLNSKTEMVLKAKWEVKWRLFGEVGEISFVFELKLNNVESSGESLTLRNTPLFTIT